MADHSGHNSPRPPLGEVALVVNFPPEASVECLRHEFYNQIRNTYGDLIPPEFHQGVPPALEPYRFDEKDGSAAVILGLNSFGYVTFKYDVYENFRRECLKLTELAQETFGISKLTRVGLRYTNIIPFTRKKGKIPLEELLTIGLKLPRGIPTGYGDLNIQFTVPVGKATVEVQIEPRVKRGGSEEALFLILSHERAGQLNMASFAEYLDAAHSETRELFKRFVTDFYRKSLKQQETQQ